MKKFKIVSIFVLALISANLCAGLNVFADEYTYPSTIVPYSIEFEDDEMMEQATKISETETRKNGRITTTTISQLKDGTFVTDVFERGDLSQMRSTSGTDTVTRTKRHDRVSISMTASFKWYLVNHLVQKVECTNASGTYSLGKGVEKVYCEVSRPTAASGSSVKATTSYHFRDDSVNTFYQGSFYIKCNDKGSISDNA